MPGKASSPWYRHGMIHGAYQAAMPARCRAGFHPAYAGSWMYRQGFARGFLAAFESAAAEGGAVSYAVPPATLAASAVQPDPAAHSAWIAQIRMLRLAGCTLAEARALAGTMPHA